MQPNGHIPHGAPASFYAWETTATGQVRWQWNDAGLAVRYCVNNSLALMKTDETNTRDYFTAPAPTLEQCREIAKLISGGDIDRLMERDGACVEWVCGEHGRLQAENRAMREALAEVLREAKTALDCTNDFLWRDVYCDAQTGPDSPPEPANAVAAEAASHARDNQRVIGLIDALLTTINPTEQKK